MVIVHLQILISKPMSLELWKAVCTRESICSLDLAKSLRSLRNKKWFKLCFQLLFSTLYLICTFRSLMVNGINANTNRKGEKESPWKIPPLMETVPKCASQAYKVVFQLGLEGSVRSYSKHPKALRTHKCGTTFYALIYPCHT